MDRPQVFNTGPPPFFRVEKAGKIAVFHTGKSCCSWVRREQTPPVPLRSTDSPFCRCAPSAPLFVTYGDISPRRGENLSRPEEVFPLRGSFICADRQMATSPPERKDFPRPGEDVAQRQKGESAERSEAERVGSLSEGAVKADRL